MLEGHTGRVFPVIKSTDGSKIVSGSEDKTVRVWSMETGEVPPLPDYCIECGYASARRFSFKEFPACHQDKRADRPSSRVACEV
jgi:WD40 repeat protein